MFEKAKKLIKKPETRFEDTSAKNDTDISEIVLDDGYLDVMEDKTVVLFFVGGTIAMKADTGGALVPAVSAEELCASVPGLSDLCSIEIQKFSNTPSPSVTPSMMLELSKRVQKALKRPEVSGAVIIHGTDTLEDTAYFLSISLAEKFQVTNHKPIVVTGAMRGANQVGADGPANLFAAVRIACDEIKDAVPQVLVCLNNEIHAASRVQKVHTGNLEAFQSPGWGPVGYVDNDAVYFRAGLLNCDLGLSFPLLKKLTAKVAVVKAVSGEDGKFIDYSVKDGCDGIVIEGFGRGNLPETMMDSVKKAIKKDVMVVIATRVRAGRVLDCYGFSGSVTDALQAGALMAGETTANKARLLLMYILSQPQAKKLRKESPQLFKAYVQECLDPVLTERLFAVSRLSK